jgi:hypothetical protein
MSQASAVAGGTGVGEEEVTLTNVVRHLKAIEDIVWPMQPVPDALAAFEDTVREQGQQQIALNLTLTRVEQQLQEPARGPRRRAGTDDEEDLGGDFLLTAHKLEFPKFDGTGDPLPWLNRCKRYFHVRRTPDHKRVAYAAFHLLDDAQLWYHRLELNGGPPTCQRFVQLVNTRFGPPLTDSPIGELALLHREGSIDDFAKRFMALSCRDPATTEVQQVQLFITGLGKPLRTDVALQRPTTLNDAVMFARAYEQRDAAPPVQTLTHPAGRSFSRLTPSTASPTSAPATVASVIKPTIPKRLSPAKVVGHRKDGKCFHCDEPFTQGHKLVCKQLFSIELVDEDDPPQTTEANHPTISIQALTGIRPCAGKTM